MEDDQFSFRLSLTPGPGSLQYAGHQLWNTRREQLKITLTSGLFPWGSYLTDEDGNVYTPGPDRTYVLIPIANVTETRYMTLTFHSPYEKITKGGTLNVGCMSSSPYLQVFQTIGGWTNATPKITYSIPSTQTHALRVDGDSHLITKTDKTVDFTVSRSDGATDLSWAAYVKEEGGGYAFEAKYSGSETVANNAAFTIDASGWSEGTYRVVFTTAGGANSYYSLIVSDENGNFVKN